MTLLFALLSALAPQDSADDLKKQVEKLRGQVQELQDRLGQLEEAAVRDAQLIQRLRTAIRTLEESARPQAAGPQGGPHKVDGPTTVLKGRVIHVDSKFGFLLINLGRKEKLQAGYTFEIVRRIYEKDGPPEGRLQKIGSAEFEKYIGEEQISSKLHVTEGSAAEMKVDDDAVAIRALSDVPDRKEPVKVDGGPRNGLYKITGMAGRAGTAGYTINYGTTDGAKQTDIVFVYKDGVLKTKLRLDTVAKEFCVGNLISPAADATHTPDVGDQVFIRELQKALAGKVALVDEKRGLVATDLRQRDGVRIGQKLEIRRLGQRVGLLSVTDVQAWGSWAKPEGDTKVESVQKGDFIEAVDGK